MVISVPKENVTNTSVWVRLNDHRFGQNIPGYFIQLELYSRFDQDQDIFIKRRNVTEVDLIKNLIHFTNLKPYRKYKIQGREFAGTYISEVKTGRVTTKQAGMKFL